MNDSKLNQGVNYQLEKTSDMYLKVKETFSRDLFDKIFTFLDTNSIIAEVGPGLGHFALECKSRRLNYIGFEPSKRLRENLNRKGVT